MRSRVKRLVPSICIFIYIYPVRVCAAGLSVWFRPYVYLYICVYVYMCICVCVTKKKHLFCTLLVIIHCKTLYNACS